MTDCRLCHKNITLLLDLGMQPVCNKFLKFSSDKEFTHNLSLGLCKSCGLIQLINPFPVDKLRPAFSWITYAEPEDHLDNLAETLSKLLGSNKNARICGISSKDSSLIERMKRLGFDFAATLDIQKDFGEENPIAGVETVQHLLDVGLAKAIAENKGKFDLVIARHILEHSYNPSKFIDGLRELISPQGHIMLEIPDCTKHLEQLDYSMIWEEHVFYFTPYTFTNCLRFNGLAIDRFEIFPYALENCMVAIARPLPDNVQNTPDNSILSKEIEMALSFSGAFASRKKLLRYFFSNFKKNHGDISFFGAGHFAGTFINIFELKDNITCVIDDNKNKQGLLMPGSRLPILNSTALLNRSMKLSIFSLNPLAEEKIITRNPEFIQKGGRFLSLFPNSINSLYSYIGQHPGSHFREESGEVYYSTEDISSLRRGDIEIFKEKASCNERQKARLCAHHDIDDRLHEMFIVHKKGAYIRPHKHLSKSESLHVIEGSAFLVVFDDKGEITKIIKLGEYPSDSNFYYRLSSSSYHTLFIMSDYFVFHETTNGPFNRLDSIFAPWAPPENSNVDVGKFMKQLALAIENFEATKSYQGNLINSTIL